MPIRFRCAYCSQLMGISRRKAGTIVRCPKCSGQVVVPNPDDQPAEDDGPEFPNVNDPGKALEDPELEDLLSGTASQAASAPARSGSRPKPSMAPSRPAAAPVSTPEVIPQIDVEAVELPAIPVSPESPRPPPGTVNMPTKLLFALAAVLLLLLVLTFLIGFLLGKQAASGPAGQATGAMTAPAGRTT